MTVSRARRARSTGRPTWRWGRRAISTSPTATATAACTSSRPSGRAQALVGRARQGPRPVLPAPRHRGRRGRARLRLRPRERSHPDLQPRRRVPHRSGPTPSGRRTSCSTRRGAPTSPSSGGTRARPRSATARSREPRYGRVSVFDRDGRVLTRWGTPDPAAPGSFAAPHGIAVDSSGDIYVAEVTWTFAVSRGLVERAATPSRSSRSRPEEALVRWIIRAPRTEAAPTATAPRSAGGACSRPAVRRWL